MPKSAQYGMACWSLVVIMLALLVLSQYVPTGGRAMVQILLSTLVIPAGCALELAVEAAEDEKRK